MTTANAYIDGFNLYNGLKRRAEQRRLENSPHRWLDLCALVERLEPELELQRLFYFTSPVKVRPGDPLQGQRQDVFIRALQTFGRIKVVKGQFQKNSTRRPLRDNPDTLVRIVDTKEKGSDVNLATFLLRDAYERKCDVAVVISDDSDLSAPVDLARTKLRGGVRVFNPNVGDTGGKLGSKWIAEEDFAACHLPDELQSKSGRRIFKPLDW